MSTNEINSNLIDSLKSDMLDELPIQKHEIQTSIENILNKYKLRTDLDFVEKIGKINFGDNGEPLALTDIPQELTDAAFIPPNAISDIALRNDIDLIISQVAESFLTIKVTTDAICESDTIDGSISKQLLFTNNDDEADPDYIENKRKIVELFEEKLELDDIIKNHIVKDSLTYGESYLYMVPYAKVFSDLYDYKIKGGSTTSGHDPTKSVLNFSTIYGNNQRLNTIRVGESATHPVEQILSESYIDPGKNVKNDKYGIFTESEVVDLCEKFTSSGGFGNIHVNVNESKKIMEGYISSIAEKISFVGEENDITLPVLEESVHDMLKVYEIKYKERHESNTKQVKTFFESVMNDSTEYNDDTIDNQFRHIKGVYMKVLPATKIIPIRIDRHVIGYYYISDGTRPEEAGERKNSGISQHTMNASSIGYDTFSPDKQMCDRLASKIINNFDMKFMRNNTALHDQIVSILQAHRFNDSLMRFIFIPAENIHRFAVNKDGTGKGHSMLEPGLVAYRMYMFLKMYCLLFQINNSAIRVYNIRTSGIDKNYKQYVQKTVRKFVERRITSKDILNAKGSMSRISGGSELVLLAGPDGNSPMTIDEIKAAEAPLSLELLDSYKNEAINASSVPSMMITDKFHDVDFAAEITEGNRRMLSMVGGLKIDLNPAITRAYRFIMRWETDLPEDEIANFKYVLNPASKQKLAITADMIGSFNAILDLCIKHCLSAEDQKPEEGQDMSDTAREFGKLIISRRLPELDIDDMMELADLARQTTLQNKVNSKKDESGNMIDDLPESQEEQV